MINPNTINPTIFKNKQVVVVGLRGTGKTTFSKWLLDTQKKTGMAIDFYANKDKDGKIKANSGEYIGYNRYAPTNKQYGDKLTAEFNSLMSAVIEAGKVSMVVVDECNRIIPNRRALPNQVMELIDKSRGFERTGTTVKKGITVVWCARRIAQLHTDVVETADFVIAFKQTGKNDLSRLDEIYAGLGDEMRRKITYSAHNFIITNGGDYSVQKINPSQT